MHSKRSREGYFMVDNRLSGGGLVEVPILTCSHCQKQLIVNPGRTRDRGYCPKCDNYICDECEAVRVATLECKPFEQVIDEVQEAAVTPSFILGRTDG